MNRLRPIATFLLVWALAGLGWLWSGGIWNEVWIERTNSAYPPEWRLTGQTDRLAGEQPIYRENDTFYWVAFTLDKHLGGDHRWTDLDGPEEGRPIAWNRGLMEVLIIAGRLAATFQGIPVEDGIRQAGHWLNPLLGWLAIGLTGAFLLRYFGLGPACLFLALAFFHPSLQWVFAYSRTDHHVLQALVLWLQLIGVTGLFSDQARRVRNSAILLGVATAGGFWISATVQVVASAAITAALSLSALWQSFRHRRRANDSAGKAARKNAHPSLPQGALHWGITGAIGIWIFCWYQLGFAFPDYGLSAIHPLYGVVILGAGLFVHGVVTGTTEPPSLRNMVLPIVGLLLGLSPLLFLLLHGAGAHVWFDSVVARLHDDIVEYQSILSNQSWNDPIVWGTFLSFGLAMATWRSSPAHSALAGVGLVFFLLCLWQERWINEVAVVSVFLLATTARQRLIYTGWGIALIFGMVWLQAWQTIREKPGVSFSSDLLLRVLGRDIAINLQAHAQGEAHRAAIPHTFAPQALSVPGVQPIGSLYWENAEGIRILAELYAETDDRKAFETAQRERIRFIVVQPRNRRFAEQVVWTAHGLKDPTIIEQSLALRLSEERDLPAWIRPLPFSGTFLPERVDARIYEVLLEED